MPFCCWVLLLGSGTTWAADPVALKDARERWLRGNYAEAQALYEKLVLTPNSSPPRGGKEEGIAAAVIGLSQVYQSQGAYDKALECIETALKNVPQDSDLSARKAELLYVRGRWEEAEKAASAALAVRRDNFLARWIMARLHWDRGEWRKADAAFRWFVRTYSTRNEHDANIKDPDELLLVGLAGSENARWHSLSDQFDFVLKEVYGDVLKINKNQWQAEYQAGMLLLEKYNRGEALNAFDKALKINPNAAEPYVGKGLAALQKLEVRQAEEMVERALKINPYLPDARRLRADIHLVTGNISAAVRELEQARKINPRDESTLGRLAACLHLQRKQGAFASLVEEVEKRNPRPGVFYHVLAERLEECRRFDEAEKFYKLSTQHQPMLPWAQNSLGLLYMRLGREKEAREILTKAFDADRFNIRVANSLKVLKHLERYETIKTKHFELRFDPATDQALARYMAPYLEEIYADLSKKFNHEPQGLILVEVFNSHEMFSGRTVALPDLHTFGACTGRMFAMCSPHAKGIRKPFNWGRVLRHEMVHVFNLDQTNFQVPHWLTEGLAVMNEGYPRPQEWNQLLVDRWQAARGQSLGPTLSKDKEQADGMKQGTNGWEEKRLLNLETIDLAFIRPRSPAEWTLAYCQAQLYVEYLSDAYGPQTVGKLLNACRDGLDTPAAIAKVCKVDLATFEEGYQKHLAKVVKSIKARPAEKKWTVKELEDACKKNPDDLEVKARLAAHFAATKEKVKARELVDAILKSKQNHPRASFVKAKLLLDAGDARAAQALLQSAIDQNDPDPRMLLELGALHLGLGNLTRAKEVLELGRTIEPFEKRWLLQLAHLHARTKDKAKQIKILKELASLDADDLESRKRLGRLSLEAEHYADAERYARQSLEIDIRDTEVREILRQALLTQKKEEEAARLARFFDQ